MAKKRGRPKGTAKDAIWCRIHPDTIAALDEIAASMRPKTSRSALIDLACAEYVERHQKQTRKPTNEH
jgi:predicted transcriptional regulator